MTPTRIADPACAVRLRDAIDASEPLLAALPDDARSRPRTRHNLDEIATHGIPTTEPATLNYFMNDYVDHLEMHLRQMLGENWNEGSTAPPMGRGSR